MEPVDHRAEAEPGYVGEHVREALLREPDIGELDVHVVVSGDRVVVSGHVSTVERQEAITRVVTELLPGHDIRNETTVTVYPEPQGPAA